MAEKEFTGIIITLLKNTENQLQKWKKFVCDLGEKLLENRDAKEK